MELRALARGVLPKAVDNGRSTELRQSCILHNRSQRLLLLTAEFSFVWACTQTRMRSASPCALESRTGAVRSLHIALLWPTLPTKLSQPNRTCSPGQLNVSASRQLQMCPPPSCPNQSPSSWIRTIWSPTPCWRRSMGNSSPRIHVCDRLANNGRTLPIARCRIQCLHGL